MNRTKEELSVLQSLEEAHRVSFMPFVFQTAVCLKNLGIFGALDTGPSTGLTKTQIQDQCHLSEYATDLLLECGVSFGLLKERKEHYKNSRIGYFLLHDTLVSVNLQFTELFCYKGLSHLEEAFRRGRPEGLKELGFSPEKPIYPHIADLPTKEQQSWFAFDHKYSDLVFENCLDLLAPYHPRKIVDVGGNTGNFAFAASAYSDEISVHVLDLPEPCKVVEKLAKESGLTDRISTFPVSVLDDFDLTGIEGDVWWMSQFLDCFSPPQINHILSKIRSFVKKDAILAIVEPCIGNQRFDVANECLLAFSLYFTALANGNSRFYLKEQWESFIQCAGFKIEKCHENIGASHTLFICRREKN